MRRTRGGAAAAVVLSAALLTGCTATDPGGSVVEPEIGDPAVIEGDPEDLEGDADLPEEEAEEVED